MKKKVLIRALRNIGESTFFADEARRNGDRAVVGEGARRLALKLQEDEIESTVKEIGDLEKIKRFLTYSLRSRDTEPEW